MISLPQKFELLAAGCSPDGGLYRCSFSSDGKTEKKEFYPLDRPMYMVREGNKLYTLLMAPFADGNSGLIVHELDEDNRLVCPGPVVPTEGAEACHLYVRGGDVFCTNYTSGSVCCIGKKLVQHAGRSLHPTRQTAPHTHFVGPTPDGQYLCVTDLGLDSIFLYDEALNAVGCAKVPAGSGVRHLAFSGDGKYCFAANELTSTVSSFAYRDGSLMLLDTVSCLPADFRGQSTCAAIRYANGKIYVSNRGHDSISVLESDHGKLTLRSVHPCFGRSPRDFIVLGDYVVVANERTDSVTVLDKNMDLLCTIGDIPGALCVLAL